MGPWPSRFLVLLSSLLGRSTSQARFTLLHIGSVALIVRVLLLRASCFDHHVLYGCVRPCPLSRLGDLAELSHHDYSMSDVAQVPTRESMDWQSSVSCQLKYQELVERMILAFRERLAYIPRPRHPHLYVYMYICMYTCSLICICMSICISFYYICTEGGLYPHSPSKGASISIIGALL